MLWMEEKWPRVADERSQAGSNILQKLKWRKITKSELLASRRYMEELQQVRMLDRGKALLSSDSQHILPCLFLWSTVTEGRVPSASCT